MIPAMQEPNAFFLRMRLCRTQRLIHGVLKFQATHQLVAEFPELFARPRPRTRLGGDPRLGAAKCSPTKRLEFSKSKAVDLEVIPVHSKKLLQPAPAIRKPHSLLRPPPRVRPLHDTPRLDDEKVLGRHLGDIAAKEKPRCSAPCTNRRLIRRVQLGGMKETQMLLAGVGFVPKCEHRIFARPESVSAGTESEETRNRRFLIKELYPFVRRSRAGLARSRSLCRSSDVAAV